MERSVFCPQTGEVSTRRISRTEYCFVGLAELLMPCPSLPWKLRDLHSLPRSSLIERAPEQWEPRPESKEDPSDGMSSHNMTTRSSMSLTDPDAPPMKPWLRFLRLGFFRTLSILKCARRSLSSGKENVYALVAGLTAPFIMLTHLLMTWRLHANPSCALSHVSIIMWRSS